MKRDKLFDIEMYREGAIFDCSLSGVCPNKKNFAKLSCQNVPLFVENQYSIHFDIKPETETAIGETEELLLLQVSYW